MQGLREALQLALASAKATKAAEHAGQQLCRGCNRWLPHDRTHFHQRKQARSGLASRCKGCCNQANVAWWRSRPDYGRARRADLPRLIAEHLRAAERLIRRLAKPKPTPQE